MFDITTYVPVGFFTIDNFVYAIVSYNDSEGWIKIKLMDKDHQSLIETLDAIWPQWHDCNQALNRSE